MKAMMNWQKILEQSSKKEFVVIDIDMTVANNKKRLLGSLVAGKIDYDKLFDPAFFKLDRMISGSRKAVDSIRPSYIVLYLSARRSDVLKPTESWLKSRRLLKPDDLLVLVDSIDGKKKILAELKDSIKLYIDDFGYNYHLNKVMINQDYICYLEEERVPFVVFNNNWQVITEKYFYAN